MITLSVDTLLQIALSLAAIAAMWGTIRTELRAIRKEHEELKYQVSQMDLRTQRINPLLERVTSFEKHMDERWVTLSNRVQQIYDLLLRASARRA